MAIGFLRDLSNDARGQSMKSPLPLRMLLIERRVVVLKYDPVIPPLLLQSEIPVVCNSCALPQPDLTHTHM